MLKFSSLGLLMLVSLNLFAQDVALDFNGDIILGAPSDDSITANVRSAVSQNVYLEFGSRSGNYSYATETMALEAGDPTEIDLIGLDPSSRYYYRLRFDQGENRQPSQYLSSQEFSFHTPRSEGSSFVFGVQGDSHPERAPRDFIPELYDVTLNQARLDGVDLYFTTGDDFSIDLRYPNGITEDDVVERYIIQRPHLGVVGNSASVFLVNGNHEQGALYLYNDARKYPAPDNPAVWVQNARNKYFTQPEPNDFYSGNDDELEYIDKGLTGTYYAFEWGDALFVTLDPFWTSEVHVDNLFEGARGDAGESQKTPNKWDITLGDAQYNWLKDTLENSDATFKFIFSHMLHGVNRGGVEGLNLFEWGGEDFRGNYQFDTQRPSWDKPLHQLMADTDVTIYFHGHDHVWVKQELDGVVYQEVSSPADQDYDEVTNWTSAYTDDSSVILGNSGYTRVSVSPDEVKVDYVRSYLPEHESDEQQTGEVTYSYRIPAPTN